MTEKEAWEYLNDLGLVPAKLKGRHRPTSQVDTIVIHRLAAQGAAGGVRYVQSLDDGRQVSWHATVDHVSGRTIRHLPVQSIGFHCKYPVGTNARSVGIEIGGPMGAPISTAAHSAVRRLCEAYCAVCPITRVASHAYLDAIGPRKNRRDPGPEFMMSSLVGLTSSAGVVSVYTWNSKRGGIAIVSQPPQAAGSSLSKGDKLG